MKEYFGFVFEEDFLSIGFFEIRLETDLVFGFPLFKRGDKFLGLIGRWSLEEYKWGYSG